MLYIVATPIGNLEDITLRALRILKEVDLILCEDTRETGKLLKHYGVHTSTMSFHAHTSERKLQDIVDILKEGKDVALVSDAGTPAISDPGSMLVQEILEKLPEVEVLTVPGPSALAAAFSISGVTGGEFTFLGFLPHKKGRETMFREIAAADRPYVFYESPHRLLKTLASLETHCPEKKVFIGRELTKVFEQSVVGTPRILLSYFKDNPDKVRGEFVLIVHS